jgi:hypothetical protein
MQAISFSWAVWLVYGYLSALLLEVLFEQRFRLRRRFRPLGTISILASGVLFVFGFVYAPDHLTVRARNINGERAIDTHIGGVQWNPAYSDLRIVFQNSTKNEYHNLDFVISSDRFIAAEGETTNAHGVQVFNTSVANDNITVTGTSNAGKSAIVPDDQMKMFVGGVRVTCEKLIKHGGLFEIVLAVAQPRPEFPIPSAAFSAHGKINPNFIMVEAGNTKDFYGAKVKATRVYIDGNYESLGGRPREIHDSYRVEER